MYVYDDIDQRLVDERVAQFRDQTRRFLAGELSEDEFRPLRLQNGLYVQRHAPMLRVAIPYGLLAARQLRKLADIAERFDRGQAHFTTRQNLQFNWPRLEDAPEILAELATVQMHAIQTSGNCIRNTTTDHFAGIAPDELVDPLVWCELIRQWSMLHPEFAFLPRKFKIAVSGARTDRAAIAVHDIGLQAGERDGRIGFAVWVGGGMGRTPMVAKCIRPFVDGCDLLTYLQAVLRIYNLHGRRDNKYKARIKILVRDLGADEFARQVEAEWASLRGGPDTLGAAERDRVAARFTVPAHDPAAVHDAPPDEADPAFRRWLRSNVHPHRVAGYAAVTVSLKAPGQPPGDISAQQMRAVADLAERHSLGELRVSHEQNLILPELRRRDLPTLWRALDALGLATPNVGLLTDIVACPGGDFCALANAVSIPLANAIQERFADLDHLHDIGELDLNISGCINSCGHHHIGHIGVLGVDKAGEEWYQVTLGGRQNGGRRAGAAQAPAVSSGAAVGRIVGPAFRRDAVPDVIERLVGCYLAAREHEDERFVDVVDRLGIEPFKQAVYAPLKAEVAHG
ncbi:nitrite/sulfite reductase [Derxia lacustris]|uniref:nitrite/sulfite reductase n=1 Tax=Derxia lacustris TaxID=764842 RepID=UPI000A16FA65|nr:nitrite/sulfite reductase [Derxia lacustris]